MPSSNLTVLADTYTNNYQDGKYKGNKITRFNAEPKGKKGIWHNKGKIETEGVVAKGTYSTSYIHAEGHRGPEGWCLFVFFVSIHQLYVERLSEQGEDKTIPGKGVHAFGAGDVRVCLM